MIVLKFSDKCDCETCREYLKSYPGSRVVFYMHEELPPYQKSTLKILALLRPYVPSDVIWTRQTMGALLTSLVDNGTLCNHCYLEISLRRYCCEQVCTCKHRGNVSKHISNKLCESIGECKCDYCKDEKKKKLIKEGLKITGKFVLTTIVCQAAIMAAPALLAAAGFGLAGVRAGSAAAGIQSMIGCVRAGSLFAQAMSMGARGALTTSAILSIRAVSSACFLGGLASKYLKKSDKGEYILPETEMELQNLINQLIQNGEICATCYKLKKTELKGKCRSVCWF